MDIYRFINSRDIRYYLKDKDYRFSTLEASWLVYQCRDVSLKEKHDAWIEIINTMPDCVIEERINCSYRASHHGFVNAYMNLQDRMLVNVMKNEENTFYQLSLYEHEIGWYDSYKGSLATYEEAYAEALEQLEDICITRARITKNRIGESKNCYVEIARNGEIYDIVGDDFDYAEDEDLYSRSFDGLCFDFPVPFRKGDIIWNPGRTKGFCSGPMVYVGPSISENKTGCETEGMQTIRNDADTEIIMKDSSDMTVEGYFQAEDGQLYNEVADDLMDYEYYTGSLDGKKAIIKALSNCLNKKIDEAAFAEAYHSILMKEAAVRSIPAYYDDEGMRLMGLSEGKQDYPEEQAVYEVREDTAKVKRVELSCFTNMSPKCGVASAEDYIERASEWGMDAIAITDRANVQAFPDAFREMKKLNNPPKVIYGIHAAFDKNCRHYDLHGCKPFSPQDTAPNILVKNRMGLTNLYRLLTDEYCSGIDLLSSIFDSGNAESREGLLIGSGGWDIEVQDRIESGSKKIEDFLDKAAAFDYLEVHPSHRGISEIQFHNRVLYIIRLGELTGKPVVATGNAGYIDPEDKICLDIFCGTDETYDMSCSEKRYLMTTDEMLEEFAFLGKDKAEEIVITNSRMIADMIVVFDLFPGGSCSPVIDNAYETLEQECFAGLNSIYPTGIPEEVAERIETELTGIMNNEYASDYVIGMKLVKKSSDDGFPVVLRGCGAGSFVAYLSGISDINPLPAHYYCHECGQYEFVKDRNIVADDLDEKYCAKCGCMMERYGYNIPAEPFTGLKGDKDPDFDFNFAREYHGKIIEYLKELFGEDHVIRPGTIGTSCATAWPAVDLNYNYLNTQEKKRIIDRLSSVKRTNGTHPGGVIIIPKDMDVLNYTPLQKVDHLKEKVTHLEYHALGHKFKCLDCLGHRGPTKLYLLKELTGKDIKLDPDNTKEVLKLFKSIYEAPEGADKTDIGTLGIPEFDSTFISSTDMAEMLKIIKPQSINDLIRMVALFHGTDVWRGNAKELLENGTASFDDVICSRDDIYLYLRGKGIKKETAYDVMENVSMGRAGSGRFREWNVCKVIMREHSIPQWYMDSCEKIRYLFPKAHSTGYTLMSLKLALYKIFYSEEFYAVHAVADSDMLKDYLELNDQEIDMLINNKSDVSEDIKILREMKRRNINFEKTRKLIRKVMTALNNNGMV